jgi:hypothetical protein
MESPLIYDHLQYYHVDSHLKDELIKSF